MSNEKIKYKAISLWQPWASLIAWREKRIETRSWGTNYRGPLLIHAAKTRDGLIGSLFTEGISDSFDAHMQQPFKKGVPISERAALLPFGAFVARCILSDCIQSRGERYWPEKERAYGDLTPGRWAWMLTNIEPLDPPIQARGRQGLWDVEL